ncbi:MAG: periplasmic heavy metal sensor [Alphaproteobacteria bacterium]|nr:periplasmic heavy metal sensor [Alphaproteobacteria bacterium]
MSTRFTQFLLALSLLLNCFVLAGFVYRSWIAPPDLAGVPPPPPANRPSPLEILSQDLKLDDGQRQAARPLFERYAAARRDRVREIQKIREQMQAEMQKPSIDTTKVDALVDQMTPLRSSQQKENLQAIAELAPKLRPDQREKLNRIVSERYGSARPPGGPGPRRPPQ